MAEQDTPISIINRSFDHFWDIYRKSKPRALAIAIVLLILSFSTFQVIRQFFSHTSIEPASINPPVTVVVSEREINASSTPPQPPTEQSPGTRTPSATPASLSNPREKTLPGNIHSPKVRIPSDLKRGDEHYTNDATTTNELTRKNLHKELQDATTRLNPDSDSEAILRLYRDALSKLAPEERKRLNQTLLNEADDQCR